MNYCSVWVLQSGEKTEVSSLQGYNIHHLELQLFSNTQPILTNYNDSVHLGVCNSPNSITISSLFDNEPIEW